MIQDLEKINLDLDSVMVAEHVKCSIDNVKRHISNNNNFNIITQNIRSLTCNLNNFLTLLHRSQVSWDVLVFSECWLQTTKFIPPLNNYAHVSTTLNKTQNEGVVIYYKNNLEVSFEEPQIIDANCLLLKLNNKTCIIAIYRPPSQTNINNFLNSLDILLRKLNSYQNIIICGDINIDIIQNTPDKRAHDYLNLLASHSILPGHSTPTHSRTCLDHIMIKTKLEAKCFVFETSITDHECVAVSVDTRPKIRNATVVNSHIDYKHLDSLIQNLNFQPIFDCQNVNTATEYLVTHLTSAIKKSMKPSKVPNRKSILKPWITSGLLRCLRHRDKLYKKLKNNPNNQELKLIYTRYRNYCKTLLKRTKTNYEKERIENAKNNNKKLWDVIKSISCPKTVIDHSTALLMHDQVDLGLNSINHYFAGLGKNLAQKIQVPSQNQIFQYKEMYPSRHVNSLVLLPTDETEVHQIINSLKENCAVAADLISTKILKMYLSVLVPPITYICNLSLSSGIFPSAFKKAVIKPIHKNGDRESINNYRPISILPALSKILERIMNRRLMKFLETNQLLSPTQYGFRHGKSTNDAVHELVNTVVNKLDERKKCLAVFLDLAKAFDTVSIPILMNKLEALGVRGIPLDLFKDYLSNRKQCVKINNMYSNELEMEYGIPQGSIIGPTLFLVYINNLCQLQLNNGKVITFADDTALVFSGQNWEEVFDSAQAGFNKVNQWLQHNLLTLNISKTNYIAFSTKVKLLPSPDLNIKAHSSCHDPSCYPCPVLKQVDNIKYLGVTVDQFLTFKPHISLLTTRLRKLIYIFKNLRQVADHNTIKIIYNALARSLIDYCITTWGGTAKSHLLEVERAQRAILKVGAGFHYRHPTKELYKHWEVLTVRQTFIFYTVVKMHSQLEYDPLLTKTKRRKGDVASTKLFNLSLSHNFFCYLAPILYNRINSKINIYSLPTRKCKLHINTYLMSLTYQDTENLLLIVK